MMYKYKAVSFDGISVSGVVEAVDEYEAVVRIKENCSIVTRLTPVQKLSGILSKEIGPRQIDSRSLHVLCSQFSIILGSGIPVTTCVGLIAGQIENKRLRKILKEIRSLVASGRSLADSFQKADKDAFPATFLETVNAGERSGTLDYSFGNLSTYYEKQYKMKQQVSSAMAYPSFVLVTALVVVSIVMAKVIPSMVNVFEELGSQLPLPTRILIAISGFFENHLFHGFIAVLMCMILAVCYIRTENGRVLYNHMKLKFPILGKIRLLGASSQFAHTMSTMLASGLTLPQALDVTAKATENYMLAKAVLRMARKIEEGYLLGDCMKEAACYPDTLNEVCALGEETGELEKMLASIGDYFDSQADFAAKKAIARLEPMLLVGMTLFAGFIVMSIYLPLFTMYDLV